MSDRQINQIVFDSKMAPKLAQNGKGKRDSFASEAKQQPQKDSQGTPKDPLRPKKLSKMTPKGPQDNQKRIPQRRPIRIYTETGKHIQQTNTQKTF